MGWFSLLSHWCLFPWTMHFFFELVNDLCIPRVTLVNDLVYASTLSDWLTSFYAYALELQSWSL
jgi:hypothetical protein